MVMEARRLVDEDQIPLNQETVQALNAFGYDEAAQLIYGMHYSEWKTRYQKKATPEKLAAYDASQPIHAQHDKNKLAKRVEEGVSVTTSSTASMTPAVAAATATTANTLLSNVCCQDVEEKAVTSAKTMSPPTTSTAATTKTSVAATSVANLPMTFTTPITVAVVTVSDRASQGVYEDLSGPAVRQTLQQLVHSNNNLIFVPTKIVPDNVTDIVSTLTELANHSTHKVDVILTTGGTGVSPRDVTPEATRQVLTTECSSLMQYVTTQCATLYNPLASLTRGTAGIIKSNANNSNKDDQHYVMVCNLPGNPKAVQEILPLLWPLLLHAVQDLQVTTNEAATEK
jgi:molybdenum cofactor synthesis domain-containing protein